MSQTDRSLGAAARRARDTPVEITVPEPISPFHPSGDRVADRRPSHPPAGGGGAIRAGRSAEPDRRETSETGWIVPREPASRDLSPSPTVTDRRRGAWGSAAGWVARPEAGAAATHDRPGRPGRRDAGVLPGQNAEGRRGRAEDAAVEAEAEIAAGVSMAGEIRRIVFVGRHRHRSEAHRRADVFVGDRPGQSLRAAEGDDQDRRHEHRREEGQAPEGAQPTSSSRSPHVALRSTDPDPRHGGSHCAIRHRRAVAFLDFRQARAVFGTFPLRQVPRHVLSTG